jgi:hypothetical protein
MTLESANYTPGDPAFRVQAPPTPVSMHFPFRHDFHASPAGPSPEAHDVPIRPWALWSAADPLSICKPTARRPLAARSPLAAARARRETPHLPARSPALRPTRPPICHHCQPTLVPSLCLTLSLTPDNHSSVQHMMGCANFEPQLRCSSSCTLALNRANFRICERLRLAILQ